MFGVDRSKAQLADTRHFLDFFFFIYISVECFLNAVFTDKKSALGGLCQCPNPYFIIVNNSVWLS